LRRLAQKTGRTFANCATSFEDTAGNCRFVESNERNFVDWYERVGRELFWRRRRAMCEPILRAREVEAVRPIVMTAGTMTVADDSNTRRGGPRSCERRSAAAGVRPGESGAVSKKSEIWTGREQTRDVAEEESDEM